MGTQRKQWTPHGKEEQWGTKEKSMQMQWEPKGDMGHTMGRKSSERATVLQRKRIQTHWEPKGKNGHTVGRNGNERVTGSQLDVTQIEPVGTPWCVHCFLWVPIVFASGFFVVPLLFHCFSFPWCVPYLLWVPIAFAFFFFGAPLLFQIWGEIHLRSSWSLTMKEQRDTKRRNANAMGTQRKQRTPHG